MNKHITKILVILILISFFSINLTDITVRATEVTTSETGESEDWPKGPQVKSISAASAIVMELNTGTILYKKNMNEVHYPASIMPPLTIRFRSPTRLLTA